MLRNRRKSKFAAALGAFFASAVLFGSCWTGTSRVAVLWTDRPEFAAYAEHFNSGQSRFKIETYYREDPAQALAGTKAYPDLVVGSWLKSASTRAYFKPLDYFFEDLLLKETAFYPRLLALGNIDSKQYLLPVSFNLPALIFSRDNAALVPTPFTLSLEDIQRLAKAYNRLNGDSFIRMGFSPRWNDEFLFIASSLWGTSFREGTPLAWDAGALEKAISMVRAWTADANRDAAAEDEFSFKYLYDPAPKLASSGRILFAYLPSDELFTVPEERRATLDFRWIVRESSIPVIEGASYLGICKNGKGRDAADAFVQWFYREDTQRELLAQSERNRTDETVFGIADGFSALRSVNEQVYPQFYPGLLGHVPPADYLSPPNILPRDWLILKSRVVLPYLHDRALAAAGAKVPTLDDRIADWYRRNPKR